MLLLSLQTFFKINFFKGYQQTKKGNISEGNLLCNGQFDLSVTLSLDIHEGLNGVPLKSVVISKI